MVNKLCSVHVNKVADSKCMYNLNVVIVIVFSAENRCECLGGPARSGYETKYPR